MYMWLSFFLSFFFPLLCYFNFARGISIRGFSLSLLLAADCSGRSSSLVPGVDFRPQTGQSPREGRITRLCEPASQP
ncbi:hypothetical protein F4774DRAFT_339902 [Daldinia eschscholtzii]|nr:hypothetical protein F4774DRAFT_339902 [Daldinia eschscholtzii]